jgi:hypothetical protein
MSLPLVRPQPAIYACEPTVGNEKFLGGKQAGCISSLNISSGTAEFHSSERKTGKWIVAQTAEQSEKLHQLHHAGLTNGCEDLY